MYCWGLSWDSSYRCFQSILAVLVVQAMLNFQVWSSRDTDYGLLSSTSTRSSISYNNSNNASGGGYPADPYRDKDSGSQSLEELFDDNDNVTDVQEAGLRLKRQGGQSKDEYSESKETEADDDELIPVPPKKGTLKNESLIGKLWKLQPGSNVTDYEDAVLVDLSDEKNMTTAEVAEEKTISTTATTEDTGNPASTTIPTTAAAYSTTTTGATKNPTHSSTTKTERRKKPTYSTTPAASMRTTTRTATGSCIENGSCHQPEVEVAGGTFVGQRLQMESEVHAFYGIPYAAPPVDKLRFKRPFPLDPIVGVFNASTMKPPCFPTHHGRTSTSAAYTKPEMDLVFITKMAQEDCLYLNIWLPSSAAVRGKLPILVWIHGEGFLSGMNQEDYVSIAGFVIKTEIIVVAIQYRLGVFGFLHLGVPEAPGNMGLLDQIQALKWINQNIKAFGGNPNSITIVGHDIGAAFVGFHLISKISPSFFKRAVMLGGTATQTHVFQTKEGANQTAVEFGLGMGCDNANEGTIMSCMMKLDAVTIWDFQSHFAPNGHRDSSQWSFFPTNDGYVLNGSPLEILSSGKGKLGPILIGGTSNEGSNLFLQQVEGSHPKEPTFISQDNLERIVGQTFGNFSELEVAAILHEYKNWKDLEDGFANQLRIAELLGDYFVTCPLRKFSDLWSARGQPTYHYLFSHKSSALNRSEWMGAVHGDELDFFFGVPLLLPDKFTKGEQELSRKAIKMLETFIKTGKPGTTWERYGRETPHYLNLELNSSPSIGQSLLGPKIKKCDFWNELFPLIRMRKWIAASPASSEDLVIITRK